MLLLLIAGGGGTPAEKTRLGPGLFLDPVVGGSSAGRIELVGEAVWARGGGGGGPPVDALWVAPAFLFTHRFVSGSYTSEKSSPRFAFTGPLPGGAWDPESRLNHRPSQEDDGAFLMDLFSESVSAGLLSFLSFLWWLEGLSSAR